MRILGVDPGPDASAFVLYDSTAPEILAYGKLPNKECMEQMLAFTPVDFCVIEMISSFGMAVGKEVFETIYWVGRLAQAWDTHCLTKIAPAVRLYRGEIKMHLCHSMRAKDSNIRQALIDRLGKPGTKKAPGKTYGISGDEWSSLAVAVCFADMKGAKWVEQS